MWSYWAPISSAERAALESKYPDDSTKREELGVLTDLVRSRGRLTLDSNNVFTWSETPSIVSDIGPPG
jgi:hypothetical protein